MIVRKLIIQKNAKNSTREILNLTDKLIEWRRAVIDGDISAQRDTKKRYQYARNLIRNHNYEQGISELRTLLDQEQSHATAHYMLGRTLVRCGQIEDGLEHLQIASSLDDQKPSYRFHCAQAAIDLGEIHLARNHLLWLLVRYPKNANYTELEGFILAKEQRWEDAEATFCSAIDVAQTSKDRSIILGNLAEIMMQQSDPEKWGTALHFLQHAWALRPGDPAIFIIRERLAKKLGRSKRLADPYQLIREQLEMGDPIVVHIHRIERNRGFEIFYYGVPGWLPWIDGAEEYKVGDHISSVLFQSVDEEGRIRLEWPELRKGQLIKCCVRKINPYGILVDY